jgi:hypothetical protein
VDAVAEQTKIPKEMVIAEAAYAHICAWVVYATDSVMLTETGRVLASERAHRGRAAPWMVSGRGEFVRP